jgi:hypothetical protein
MRIEKVSCEYAVAMVPQYCRLDHNRGLQQNSGRYAGGNNAAIFYPSLAPNCQVVERFGGLGHYYALVTK